jgi:hypothetical protein
MLDGWELCRCFERDEAVEVDGSREKTARNGRDEVRAADDVG